jgi:hypothetical protein
LWIPDKTYRFFRNALEDDKSIPAEYIPAKYIPAEYIPAEAGGRNPKGSD